MYVSERPSWAVQDVCRALALDLKGQTSASYNMRLNYEKTLLEFENYLSCGQYSADAARSAQRTALHPTLPGCPRERHRPGVHICP